MHTGAVKTPNAPVFISWIHAQGRTTALARALGAEVVYVSTGSILDPRTAPFRYVGNAVVTLATMLRRRPPSVIVMAPPLPAVMLCWLYCTVARRPLVIDMHTGVYNDPKWGWARRATWWLARRSTLTVVTNEALVDVLQTLGIRAVAVDDPPEQYPSVGIDGGAAEAGRHVLVPCSYTGDEPVDAIIGAAGLVPGAEFVLTGKAPADVLKMARSSANVRFTGFVDDAAYLAILQGAGAVLCLTTQDLTMQRGGYEALAAAVPLVTSDFPVLRSYFTGGAVFTEADPHAIADAVKVALRDGPALSQEMAALYEEKRREWPLTIAPLREALGVAGQGSSASPVRDPERR
jgi:glycosyltransferase involved in cell wall biosynthesis